MFTFPRTKIQPPRQRPGLLRARPALDARLSEALLSQRLVLVCAAAGYGKTSALASQADALPAGTALAWVSCDAGDSPLQLFQCLVNALEPFDPPWRVEPEALIQRAASDGTPAATQRALRTMVAELINALDPPLDRRAIATLEPAAPASAACCSPAPHWEYWRAPQRRAVSAPPSVPRCCAGRRSPAPPRRHPCRLPGAHRPRQPRQPVD